MGAHRKHKHPTKVYPSNIRTMVGADFNALDAIVDTRNARGQGRWSPPRRYLLPAMVMQ
jgi:hypothetical protein